MYVPLWVKSHYSFLEGTCSPEALVNEAARLQLPAVALTDKHGLYGMVQAHTAAKAAGIKLLVGAELSVQPGSAPAHAPEATAAALPGAHATRRVLVIAPSSQAYTELCTLLTHGQSRAPKGQCLVTPQDLRSLLHAWVLTPSDTLVGELAPQLGSRLMPLILRHRWEGERRLEQQMRAQAARFGLRCAATTEVLFHTRARKPLQDIMRCIANRTELSQAGHLLTPNAEHALLSPFEMRRLYSDVPEDLKAGIALAERCEFTLDTLHYRYPHEADDEIGSLRERAYAGARTRFGTHLSAATREQLERELALVAELEFGGYFLTMHDIVRFCASKNILCQGRGSAANSLLCYCLGITAVDPLELDLLFERFLSRERAEPPDIDLDIEHQRREEVIQWLYSHYGEAHAAMVANVVRYRPKSALRDVGAALGLDARFIDQAARKLSHFDPLPEDAAELTHAQGHARVQEEAPRVRWLLKLCHELQGAPRHLSIHPGGFVLGRDPLVNLGPVEPATMPGRTVLQWDKRDIEALGLFKVDLLALGALSAIRHSFDLIEAHERRSFALHTVPKDDPLTYAMIAKGDTVGVFQIESRAQMSMLPRLKPRTYYDLVVQVAIVRPGPIQGDMVHPYIRRRNGEEAITFPHPALKRVLAKTLGVPIFQEQVMRLAVLVAGYTPGEADQLRRDMAAFQKQGRIEGHRQRLIEGMLARGIPETFAERIFAQIMGFGEYGFPESHAASFARLAYITAYLRCHHPAAFLCALLNAQPMGFYAPATLIEDGKRRGITVLPVNLNFSEWDCTLEGSTLGDNTLGDNTDDLRVRLGLRYLKGLGPADRTVLAPLLARPHGKRCNNLTTLLQSYPLAKDALFALAEGGALDSLGLGRRALLWRISQAQASRHDALNTAEAGADARAAAHFPALSVSESVYWDYERSGLSTRGHPMRAIREQLPPAMRSRIHTADMLSRLPHGSRVDYLGCVICRQRPHTAGGVVFLTLEDETGLVNAIIWERVFDSHAHLIKHTDLLGLRGHTQRQDGVLNLIVEAAWSPHLTTPTTSRDFH